MKSFQIALASLVLALGYNVSANAATEVVAGFGQNGWYSWDTRNTSGTTLNGTNDTSPDINSTLLGRSVGSASTANDTAIGANIIFMDEGIVANDNGDAAGNPPPASPLGSLNGLGYVRLDGTGSNSGKSDISYVDANGFASASALLNPNFNVTYRYYIQPQNTFRTLGLNIALTDAAKDNLYIFAYSDPAAANGWNTSAADNSTSLFTLFANGSSAAGGTAKTLSDWAADSTFGPQIFAGTESVFRLGFNLGSGQRDNLQYLDWMSTSLLNNGDLIDFQVLQAVPEPATWLAALLAAGGVLGMRFRRRISLATQI
jgi:hypothetical protein